MAGRPGAPGSARGLRHHARHQAIQAEMPEARQGFGLHAGFNPHQRAALLAGQAGPGFERRLGRAEGRVERRRGAEGLAGTRAGQLGLTPGAMAGNQPFERGFQHGRHPGGQPGIGGQKGGQGRGGRGGAGRPGARGGSGSDQIAGKGGPAAPGSSAANPAAAAPGAPAAPAPGAAPPAGQAPGATGAPSTGNTFQDFINSTFGGGSPFGMRGNYSDPNNPIYAAARRNYEQGLAGTRSRFGASGLGNSSREALAEGDAAADFGAQIAQIGEGAYQSDAARALQAALGGQQNLLGMNAQLGNLGNQLTGIGASEQMLPGLSGLLSFLSTFGPTLAQGTTGTSQKSHLF